MAIGKKASKEIAIKYQFSDHGKEYPEDRRLWMQ